MRPLSILLALTVLLLGLLALLNLGALLQTQDLNLGWRTVQAPLGLVFLGLAALALLLAAGTAAVAGWQQGRERRSLAQERDAQRALAEKAEGSRFAELQRHLDLQAQAVEHRERELRQETSRQLDQLRQALQQQLDEVGSSLAAYIGEVEDRLERRRLLRPASPDRPAAGHH